MFRGNAIAQAIAIIASIYLAKLYGADAYGIFGTFISITTIVSIVNTLQLENGIIISKTDDSRKNWIRFLFILVPILTLLISLSYYLIKPTLINFKLILIIFFTAIFLSFNKILEASFTFLKHFKNISNGKIILAFTNITFQFIFYYYFKIYGLILGFLTSTFILLLYYFYKSKIQFKKFDNETLKRDLREHNSIIKYLLPSSTINGLAIHLMPILILAIFSAKEAGEYFLSLKILLAPLFLLSTSVSQVFYQKSSDLYHHKKNELFKISKKIVLINTILMFVFIILINTIGVYLLEYFLDKDWNNLKQFIFLLSFLVLARATFNPISSLIVVLNKNHIGLIFNIFLLIGNLFAIYLGYIYNNITYTIIISVIFGSVGYLILLTYFLSYLKKLQNV